MGETFFELGDKKISDVKKLIVLLIIKSGLTTYFYVYFQNLIRSHVLT